MKNFSIISAIDENRGIGINNQLPWQLKADLKHFSEITVGQKNNAVIMGLNTWKSLPEKYRPLPDRLNVVLSKESISDLPENVLNFQSLDEALKTLEEKKISSKGGQASGLNEIFIIGGGMLYASTINHPNCNKLYLTEILKTFDCDTFFPEIPSVFKKTQVSDNQEENGIPFRFAVFEKISNDIC